MDSRPARTVRVTLIGPFPPPYGGVSVHVQRLQSALKARGIDVEVLTGTEQIAEGRRSMAGLAKASWFARQLFRGGSDVVHFHGVASQLGRLRPLSMLSAAGRPVVATLHSFRKAEVPRDLTGLTQRAVRHLDHIICVSEPIRTAVLSYGVPPERTSVLPPYIPPSMTMRMPRLSPAVERFLESHDPVLTANASELRRIGGKDIYGLDLCITLTRTLADEYPRLGFLFVIGSVKDEEYLNAVQRRVEALGLGQRFMILPWTGEFWPILRRSTAFIRPTTEDSYGISVAEALDLGVPAIASDVCQRPVGTLLFRTGDVVDAERQVRRVLSGPRPRAMAGTRSRWDADWIGPILDVYRRAIQRRSGLPRYFP